MPTGFVRARMRALRRDERGIAMIMALGMLVALTITALALVEYSGSNLRTQNFSADSQSAAAAAESGLNEAVSVLANAADPISPTAVPPGSATIEGSEVTWSGVLDSGVWTITSVARAKNPTGAGDIYKSVTARFRAGIDTLAAGNTAWRTVYADAGCSSLSNNSVLAATFVTHGDLCLQNSAEITAPEVSVAGHITLRNSSEITTGPLHTGTGCGTSTSGPWSLSNCTPATGVNATSVDSTLASYTKPPIELAEWYAASKPGPLANCTSGSFPGGFDNNTTLDHSLPQVMLLSAEAYSCTFSSAGTTIGKIAWTPGSPGTFEISGVVFIDGDIRIGGDGVYTGQGTIYSSGSIDFSNTDRLCAVSGCGSGVWNGMLVLVAGSSSTTAIQLRNSGVFQGALYAVGDVVFDNSGSMEGPIIANTFTMNNGTGRQFTPTRLLPYGTPSSTSATVGQVSGSWG